MADDLLSLKWNNHRPAFFQLLRTLREKGSQTDVTIACGSRFFHTHRLVLMACSDFFAEVFTHTTCLKPVIVLKDVCALEMDALLDYMYLGEVDVPQTNLPALIKAAEALQIKGLAVPDSDPAAAAVATAAVTTTAAITTTAAGTEPVQQPQLLQQPETVLKKHRKQTQEEEEEQRDEGEEEEDKENGGTTTTTTTTTSIHKHHVRSPKKRKLTSNDLELEDFEVAEVKIEACDLSDELMTPSYPPCDPLEAAAQTNAHFAHFLSSEDEGRVFEVISGHFSGSHGLEASANSSSGYPVPQLIGQTIQDDSQPILNKPTTTITTSAPDPVRTPPVPPQLNQGGYFCPSCFKRFNDRYKRDRHLLIHTGEKPFKCPVCDYRSSRKDPVIRHMKFKHTDALTAILSCSGGAGSSSGSGIV